MIDATLLSSFIREEVSEADKKTFGNEVYWLIEKSRLFGLI